MKLGKKGALKIWNSENVFLFTLHDSIRTALRVVPENSMLLGPRETKFNNKILEL